MRSANFFVTSHPVKKLLGYMATFVLLTVVGCGQSYPPSLQAADSLMNERPDSALALLDDMEADMASAAKSVRMRYQLLRHKAMNKAYVPFTSDSLMLLVTDYYDDHGTANDRMLAHYLLGCVYRDLGEAPKALSAYHDAVDCADTTSTDCDFTLLSRVHGQTAKLLEALQLPHDAIEETKLASRYAYLVGDTLMGICSYAYQSALYYLMGDLDSVVTICNKSYSDFLNHGDTLYSLLYSVPAISAYLSMDSVQRAGELLNRFQIVHRQYASEYIALRMLNSDLVVIGSYYRKINMLDSARFYYNMVTPDNANTTLVLYRELAHYFASAGIPDSTLYYAEKYVSMDDTVYRESVRKDFQKMHAIYNYEHSERKAAQKANELMLTKFVVSVVFLLLVILFIVVIVVNVKKRYTVLKRLNALNASYADSLQKYNDTKGQLTQLQNTVETNRVLLSALKQESDVNRELAEHLQRENANMILDISEKEKEIDYLKKEISVFQEDRKNPEQWDLQLDIFKQPVILHLHEHIKYGQRPTDEELSETKRVMEIYYPHFIPKLKELYPKISTDNILFCIFIKLRFIPSELSIIFGLTPQSVSNRRNSLCKIMFKGHGSAKEFDHKIRKIG